MFCCSLLAMLKTRIHFICMRWHSSQHRRLIFIDRHAGAHVFLNAFLCRSLAYYYWISVWHHNFSNLCFRLTCTISTNNNHNSCRKCPNIRTACKILINETKVYDEMNRNNANDTTSHLPLFG